MNLRRTRLTRRLTFIVAALPLFQLFGPCLTGSGQVLGNTANSLPAIGYNAVQNLFLLPYEVLLAIAVGGFGSTGGGIGGSGGGIGGSGGGLGGSGI